jgi:hypothetical protein
MTVNPRVVAYFVLLAVVGGIYRWRYRDRPGFRALSAGESFARLLRGTRMCPKCGAIMSRGTGVCPHCQFPQP